MRRSRSSAEASSKRSIRRGAARTTQRVFRRYVCVPVKWVRCRYRLQQAALEIESHPGVDHADLAVRLGW
jgi:hypothetical protein